VVPGAGNPQALNRYAYVVGNPVRYNDPSGHCPWCIGAAIGAAVGAVVGAASAAAPQMIQNVRDGQPLTANIDPGEVGKAAVAGAVAGAVGGATFYIGTAVVAAATGATGISLGNMALSGAISGALSGQASRATDNLLNGETVTDGLGDPKDILVDAAVGGTLAFLGGAADQAIARARFSGTYTRYIGEGELQAIEQTGLLRGGRPGETYFTTDHYVSENSAMQRLALKQGPDYRVEFELLNQPSIVGPERVAPSLKLFRWGWGIQYWTSDPVQVRVLRYSLME